MLNTVEVAPRQTSWRDLTRRTVGPVGRRLEPYGFLSPTLVILLILMLGPIGTVIRYSTMNNVILQKAPVFVGLINYVLQGAGLIDSKVEWLANPSMALYAVTFINIWSGYPFYMMSLLAGLQGISSDLYEAARVDGAGGFQRFTHITIPQLRPIIVSIALLDVIFTTQQFALIWLTTGGGPINV